MKNLLDVGNLNVVEDMENKNTMYRNVYKLDSGLGVNIC